MKINTGKLIQFKRRMSKKTDYRLRLELIKSGKHRLVVRRSHNAVHLQLVRFVSSGDITDLEVNSGALRKFGWTFHTGSIPVSYLTGYLLGMKAKHAGITEAVLDIGLNRSVGGSSIYAAVKGAIDAGLDIPVADEVLPSPERLNGSHISAYAKILKSNTAGFSKQFGKSIGVENMQNIFESVKKKISEGVHND